MLAALFGLVLGFTALSVMLDSDETESCHDDDEIDRDGEIDRAILEAPEAGTSISATAEDDVFLVDRSDARSEEAGGHQGKIYNFDPDGDVIAVGVPEYQGDGVSSLSSIRIEERSDSDSSLVHIDFSDSEGAEVSAYTVELVGVTGINADNLGLVESELVSGEEVSYHEDDLSIGEEALAGSNVEIVFDFTEVSSDDVENITCNVDTDTIAPNEHEVYEYIGYNADDRILIELPSDFSGDIIQVPAREIAVDDDGAATFSEQYIIVRPGYLEEVAAAVAGGSIDVDEAISMKGIYAVIIVTSGPVPETVVPVHNDSGDTVGLNTLHPYWNSWPTVSLSDSIDRLII